MTFKELLLAMLRSLSFGKLNYTSSYTLLLLALNVSNLGSLLLLEKSWKLFILFLAISKSLSPWKLATGSLPSIWLLFSFITNSLGNCDLKNGSISVILLNDRSIYVRLADTNEHTVVMAFFFRFMMLIYGVTYCYKMVISSNIFFSKFRIESFYILRTWRVASLLLVSCSSYSDGRLPIANPVISFISLESNYRTLS